jgi:cytochrome c biogenesis protein CcmG/thiol:disulfide interchange protein DsbE
MTIRTHRRWALLITALALVAAACSTGSDAAATPSDEAGAPPTGSPLPATEFEMFDGATASFGAYAGTPLVVNWWASWCPSCVAEMSAAFRPAQQKLGDRVAFLGLNIQDDRATAVTLVEETGVLFDLAEDPAGDIYLELGGLGMPFTIFVTADGRVVEKHNGPLTEQQLLDKIDEVLLG